MKILRKRNVYKSKFKCDTIIISRNSSYMCSEWWVQRGPCRCCFFFYLLISFFVLSVLAPMTWVTFRCFMPLCHFAFLFLFVFSSCQTFFFFFFGLEWRCQMLCWKKGSHARAICYSCTGWHVKFLIHIHETKQSQAFV